MQGSAVGDQADAIVIGGGTVGGWCAYFLRRSGLARVVLIEKRTLGQGASSRAAGVVRTQGGTPWAVQLGEWSRRFYLGQQDELGIDSGFTPQGYLLPCFSTDDVAAARKRMAMQNAQGLSVRWLEPDELDRLNPAMAPGLTLGGTFCAEDGYLTPPRNVTAYAVALATSGVIVRERVTFTGLSADGERVIGVQTSAGPIAAPLVVLTGGPELADVGKLKAELASARVRALNPDVDVHTYSLRLDATTAKALRDDQRQFISAIDDGFDNQLWGKAGPPDSASERRKAVAALRRGPDDDTPETDALPTLEAQLNQRAAFLKALTPASAAAPFAGLWKNFGGELLIEPSVMAAARSAPDNNAFRVTLGVASFGFAKYQCHFAGVFKLTGDALLAQSAHNNDLDEDIIDNLRIRRDGSTVTIDDDVPHQAKGDDPYTICPRVPNLTGPLFHTSLSAAQGHHLKPEDDD